MVTPFQTDFGYVCDVITGIAVSSVLLTAVVLLHIHIYHVRQTRISELNRELGERNETLERYNLMKSDFLAAVAHEIRTPLDFIVAGSRDTLDLLEAPPINIGEIMDNQEKIKQRAMRIDGIVMDLMDAVAIENGRLSLSRQLIRLSEFLKSACGAGLNKPDAGDNRVEYDLEPGLSKVWADPARIEQVMANLISNAVRHTKSGVITVKLAREKSGKSQIVSVADSGEGMGAEAAFKKYAPSSGREGKHWRHGIGLYVCRQIIAAHGGEIWIDSEKGRGTTVSFSLMEEHEDERMVSVDPDSGG
jgi:signal transduction histidine kinase